MQDQTGGHLRGGGRAVFGANLSRPTGSFGQRRKKSEAGQIVCYKNLHFKVLPTLGWKESKGEKLVAGVGLEPMRRFDGS